jgi:distribution and morphology protein 31
MSGSFDNSLFTILPRQVHGNSGVDFDDVVGSGRRGGDSEWMKHSRLRLDGLSIDHLNRGVQGPFSWIHEGNVDVVADIMLPNDSNDGIAKVMSDVYDRVEATVTSTRRLSSSLEQPAPTRSSEGEADALAGDGEQPAEPSPHSGSHSDDDRYIVMDLRVHLTNVRAAVPLFTKELSYVNNAMIRPIVAYINSKNAFIPIHCRIVKRASDFDGSWTIFDSGLMEDLSAEVSLSVFS